MEGNRSHSLAADRLLQGFNRGQIAPKCVFPTDYALKPEKGCWLSGGKVNNYRMEVSVKKLMEVSWGSGKNRDTMIPPRFIEKLRLKERTINNLNKLMSFLPSSSLLVDHITRYARSSRLEYNKKSC